MARSSKSVRLALESLDSREVPATLTWDPAPGNVSGSLASNWDSSAGGNAAPNDGDNLVFPDGTGDCQLEETILGNVTLEDGYGCNVTIYNNTTVGNLTIYNGSFSASSLKSVTASGNVVLGLVSSGSIVGNAGLNNVSLYYGGTGTIDSVQLTGTGSINMSNGATTLNSYYHSGSSTTGFNVRGGTLTLQQKSTGAAYTTTDQTKNKLYNDNAVVTVSGYYPVAAQVIGRNSAVFEVPNNGHLHVSGGTGGVGMNLDDTHIHLYTGGTLTASNSVNVTKTTSGSIQVLRTTGHTGTQTATLNADVNMIGSDLYFGSTGTDPNLILSSTGDWNFSGSATFNTCVDQTGVTASKLVCDDLTLGSSTVLNVNRVANMIYTANSAVIIDASSVSTQKWGTTNLAPTLVGTSWSGADLSVNWNNSVGP